MSAFPCSSTLGCVLVFTGCYSKHHRHGGFKQHLLICSQLGRLQVHHQDSSKISFSYSVCSGLQTAVCTESSHALCSVPAQIRGLCAIFLIRTLVLSDLNHTLMTSVNLPHLPRALSLNTCTLQVKTLLHSATWATLL